MGRKISALWVGCLLAAFLTAGIAGASTIKLGAHAPQSGALAKHGIEQIKGIRLAAEDFEKKAKVKVELIVYDDESNPQKAVSAVEKLAGVDKVNAIVGGYGSNLVGRPRRPPNATIRPT